MKYEGWNVGSIIRQLRRDKNMTIDELSEAVGKSVSHITQVEDVYTDQTEHTARRFSA